MTGNGKDELKCCNMSLFMDLKGVIAILHTFVHLLEESKMFGKKAIKGWPQE